MLKSILPAALIFLFISEATAQCNPVIYPSPGFVQISSDQSLNATGTGYWICEGVNVTVLSSPGSAYYLEKNATITINGSDGDQVYAKDNCVVTNNSTQNIGVTCNPSTTTLNNNGGGTLTVVNICTPLTYDYSLLPGGNGGACGDNSTGISTNESSDHNLIFPNPAKAGSPVTFSGSVNTSVIIYDITGNIIKSIPVQNNSFITTGLIPGYYFIAFDKKENAAKYPLVIVE